MYRYFRLNHPKGDAYLKEKGVHLFFPDEVTAKGVTEEINAMPWNDGQFYVSLGPDNINYTEEAK